MQRFKHFPQAVSKHNLSKKAMSKIAVYLLLFSFFVVYQIYFFNFIQIIFAASPGPQYSNLKTNLTSPVTYSQGVNYQFNATWTSGSSVSSVTFELNGTNTTVTTSQGSEYYTNKSYLGAGNYTYRWLASDSLSVWNTTWHNTTFKYRKPITISNSGSALTDYQIKLNITFVSGKMNSDFSDLRFTNSSGTQLSYWSENVVTSTYADIWVKVPVIPASGSETVYMYYGNTTQTSSLSNFTNTMILLSSNPSFTTYGSYNPTTNNIQENAGDTVKSDDVYGDMRTTDSWTAQDEGCYWIWDFGSSASRSFFVEWYNSLTGTSGYCGAFTTTISVSADGSSYTTIGSNQLTSISTSSLFTNNYNGTYRYVKVDQYSTTACMATYGYSYVDVVWARNYASTTPTTSFGTEEIIQNYTINKASGGVSFSLSTASQVNYPTETNASCIRTAGDSTSTITLYRNGSQVASGTTSPQSEVATLAGGIYNYTCVIPATQNYTEATSASNILTVIPNTPNITIFFNSSKVWWNDSVYASGLSLYSNGTVDVGSTYTFYINGANQCGGSTNSSGGWSCTFRAPIEIGSFTATVSTSSTSNSTTLYVRPKYGETPSGTSDRAVYENPFFIQDMNGKLKMVMVRITTWKR